jgi:RHS repeat-associated protein
LQTQTQGTDVNPFTFVGKQGYYWDSETGLYQLDRRPYDPPTCRFLQPDPIPFQSDEINLYLYCKNNPTNRTDPSGLSSKDLVDDARNYEG